MSSIRISEVRKAMDPFRREKELLQRIAGLEKELRTAAQSAERLRKAKATRVQAKKARRRGRTDRIRIAFGDLHGSKMDHAAVAAFLGDVRALDPDEIIIGGDLTDCGGFLAQHHTLGYVAETEYSWEQDNEAANEFLDALQTAAPRAEILYLEGNHENRVERWIITQTLRNQRDAGYLRRILGPESMLHLARRKIAFFARNEIHGACRQPGFVQRGKCFFVHEISGASNAAAVALNKVAGNVVFFHTHREDAVRGFRPGVGVIGAWNPGCLCQLRPMWMHTKPNDWTTGYATQMVAASGSFLHVNVPIVDGQSLLIPFTTR